MKIVDGNKWIYFELIESKPKTQVWDVINKSSKEPLARIYWYYYWRQYVICPEPETIYNDGCLETIITFIKRLNKEKIITTTKEIK